ncbi:hypothetical protein PoB_003455900 [Plakobranchus ocellatus]|uniref:Uncharacterized protein n=1 Tax=Plakobranchus ocellatus TaxID=259542 RepID=A0AAV4APC7_9GAST|nr:hypothetical protein PoB_003455900 [Plakobranchus ocellatus]
MGAPLQASGGLHLLLIPASSMHRTQTNLAHELLSRFWVNRCEAHRRLLSHPSVPQYYLELKTYLEHVRYSMIPKHTIKELHSLRRALKGHLSRPFCSH